MSNQQEQIPPQFKPRVEAEEGDPTLADFLIAGFIVVVVIAGILWAMGLINLPR
jgi:heme/copper-type cytochrome/quinol oxidase subunit 4